MTTLQQPNGPAGDPDAGDNGTLQLLREIESGATDPKCITPLDRRQLVSFFMGDGYSTAEMSQILQVGHRTIERDKKAIREGNAIQPDPKMVAQMVGRLVADGDLAIQRIRKVVRDKEVCASTRGERDSAQSRLGR